MIKTVGAITIHIHKEIEPRKTKKGFYAIVDGNLMEFISTNLIEKTDLDSVMEHFDEVTAEIWDDFWKKIDN